MDKAAKSLFVAIFKGDMGNVEQQLSRAPHLINYSLTTADIAELRQEVNGIFEEYDAMDGFEEGMTPLLLALSRERVSIAKRLLSQSGIDVRLTNQIGVNALHMLMMIDAGDGRYDASGEQVQELHRQPGLDKDLAALVKTLIAKGCPLDNPIVQGTAVNLITEAFVHDKAAVAEILIKNGAPLPCSDTQLKHIRNYYHMNLDDADTPLATSCRRLKEVLGTLSQSPHFFEAIKSPSFKLTDVATIKAILSSLVTASQSHQLKSTIDCADVLTLLEYHFCLAKLTGVSLDGHAFNGYLNNFGKGLPAKIKQRLREGAGKCDESILTELEEVKAKDSVLREQKNTSSEFPASYRQLANVPSQSSSIKRLQQQMLNLLKDYSGHGAWLGPRFSKAAFFHPRRHHRHTVIEIINTQNFFNVEEPNRADLNAAIEKLKSIGKKSGGSLARRLQFIESLVDEAKLSFQPRGNDDSPAL